MPAGTATTTTPPHGREPVRDNSERSKRARTSAPLAGYDGRAPGSATDTPDSSGIVPATAEAPRATAYADLTRACPKTGDEIRIHGQSTSAMVISTHLQQRHLLNVRWNNRMRQHSTIDMTDVASVKEPQRDASPDVAISCTGPKQASTSVLARRSSSLGPIRGLEQSTTARRETASDDWVA